MTMIHTCLLSPIGFSVSNNLVQFCIFYFFSRHWKQSCLQKTKCTMSSLLLFLDTVIICWICLRLECVLQQVKFTIKQMKEFSLHSCYSSLMVFYIETIKPYQPFQSKTYIKSWWFKITSKKLTNISTDPFNCFVAVW